MTTITMQMNEQDKLWYTALPTHGSHNFKGTQNTTSLTQPFMKDHDNN